MRYKLLQSETACGVGTGNGSNFGSSTAVRVVNSGTTNRLMSVETSANVLIGTFTMDVKLLTGESFETSNLNLSAPPVME